MGKKFLFKALSRFVDIKPGEEVLCFFLFLYFFSLTAPNTIIQAFKNTKYLILQGSRQLPVAYLLTAVLMGFVVTIHTRLQEKVQRQVLVISSLLFFIVTCPLFGLLFMGKEEAPSWLPLIFWIWSNVFVVVMITQFWIVINDVFNPREAKRLIGFFGSGGILGGIIGGVFAGYLAQKIPDYLLYIATGILIISCLFINYVFVWQERNSPQREISFIKTKKPEESEKVGFKTSFDAVRQYKFLVLLAAVVTVTEIVSTFIDFQTKAFIEVGVVQKNMMSFFGYFEAALLVVPLLFQLFVTSKIIKRYGVRFALLLYPLTILLCSLGLAVFAVSAGLVFAVIIKTSDKSLSFSINQSVRELLYIPVSQKVKNRAKIFIDMFVNRVAKGVGALILMMILAIIPLFTHETPPKLPERDTYVAQKVQIVSAFSVLFILAWIFLNIKTSKEYTNTVKNKLKLHWKRADAVVDEKLDVDFMKLILDTLEDKNRSEVLYAMDIFDLIKKDKLTPEVRKLIAYKSDDIKVSSMDVLFQTEGATLVPQMDDNVFDETLEKEIQEIMQLDSYQEVMKDYMDKVMVQKEEDSETAKMELAKGIGLMDATSPLVSRLEDLINDTSLDVSRYAMDSAARLKLREFLPLIIEKLKNPPARADAASALEKFGIKIIGTLSDYLGDADEHLEVRRAVVPVLARTKNQEAADFISLELASENDAVDKEIIDALDKIRSEKPNIQFSADLVKPKILTKIENQYHKLLELPESKPEKKRQDEIYEEASRGISDSLMDIFKLLGLLYPYEDIIKAYQNIELGTKESIAYAVELLDNILPKEIKILIFPLVENLTLEERIRKYRDLLPAFSVYKNKR